MRYLNDFGDTSAYKKALNSRNTSNFWKIWENTGPVTPKINEKG